MVIRLKELVMILELQHQRLSITAIARRAGRDPKTVHKYIERRLFGRRAYGPRQVGRPSKLAPYLDYVRERIAAFPDLTAVRLSREIRERGYNGAYTAGKVVRVGNFLETRSQARRGRKPVAASALEERLMRVCATWYTA